MQTKTLSGFQLSPQQKRLWRLQQDNFTYLTQCALLIEGDLDVGALKAALQQVIERHAILRTSFRRPSGRKFPVMVVADQGSFDWQESDLSDQDEQEQSAKLEALFLEVRHRRFDWEHLPLLRLNLLKLSSSAQVLHVSLPALCVDSWTIKILVAEISRAYSACLKGESLGGEVVQYLQFSEWQNQLLTDEEAEAARKYWQQQESHSSATLHLPFEQKTSKQAEFEPNSFSLAIAPNLTAKIEALAQKTETAIATVLLACWQILIWRLTGQPDTLVLGIASDRREYEELHTIMGLLASWLPIKSQLFPDFSFQEVIESAAKALDYAEEWQDYFTPEPEGKDTVMVFPIGFEFEESPPKHLAGDVSISLNRYSSFIELFKVKLVCTSENNSLKATFYYDINYFSADAIQRLAGRFQTLLTAAVKNPEAAINQLEVITPSERQHLLIGLNQTQIDYSNGKCIHQLFEEQAIATPDKVAAVFEDQQITYGELNARANQLAHYLQQLGVAPGTLVGLYVERSLEMIVALLGILKAGGAYLPLDPALPKSGLAFRLQDAQANILLTQRRLANNLTDCASRIVCLDSDWKVLASLPREPVDSNVNQKDLVYAIYTSGSTGKPKGVAIEHRQLLNYLCSIEDILNLPLGASFASISTLAADLGNTVVFSSLCGGGCLHVMSLQRASNALALARYFQRYPIDCLKIVPSHLAALLTSSLPQVILPRQLLILGGEAVSWKLIQQIQQLKPECRIVNHYGPTEATVGTLTCPVRNRQASYGSETVPLGRPLANTKVYVLDEQLQLLPLGVKGELYISGAGLARGYINRPEETAARFIANPFLEKQCIEFDSETRLYRTGDLVRYLPGGNLEFVGRMDHQVKIRGFRIELGEIEALLNKHPDVQQSVVSVQEDDPNNKRLLAYVVINQERTIDVSDLRKYLREKLPEYMIPSAFFLLKALPLTPNGKVDRRALPAPDSLRPELEATYVPPGTEMEQTIAGIWQEMLHLEKVGIDDNFFDLGGHSLLIIQVHSRLQESLKRDLSITDLFEYPTIRSLTQYLSKETSEVSSFEASDQRAEGRIAARQSRIRAR